MNHPERVYHPNDLDSDHQRKMGRRAATCAFCAATVGTVGLGVLSAACVCLFVPRDNTDTSAAEDTGPTLASQQKGVPVLAPAQGPALGTVDIFGQPTHNEVPGNLTSLSSSTTQTVEGPGYKGAESDTCHPQSVVGAHDRPALFPVSLIWRSCIRRIIFQALDAAQYLALYFG